jgi:hypothetical protein
MVGRAADAKLKITARPLLPKPLEPTGEFFVSMAA